MNVRTVQEPARDIPVVADVDVVVAGGGPAGYGAVVSAARNGATAIVIEQYGYLGGLCTQGMVRHWPIDRGTGTQDLRGLPQETLDLVAKLDAVDDRTSNWWFNEDVLKYAMDRIVDDSGAQILFHSVVVAPILEGGTVGGVIVENKSGRMAIRGKTVVDCTGDADLAAAAGAPFHAWNAIYGSPLSYKITIGNVDESSLDVAATRELIARAYREGKMDALPGRYRHAPARPHEGNMTQMLFHICSREPLDPWDMTLAEKEARRKALQFWTFLRENAPGYENSYLAQMATQASVEATRRILGEYLLTGEDVMYGRTFPDVVCTAAPKGHHKQLMQDAAGVYNGIPYRSLLPQEVENLLVAGRCFSSTYDAYSGHPFIPACILLGQAAGTAAALAAKSGVSARQVDVPRLQEAMRAQGVWLGGDR